MSEDLLEFAAGGLSGCLCRLATHPLDTVKTVTLVDKVASPLRATALLFHREGLRGFYRGVGIATAGALPGNALYFGSYTFLSRSLGSEAHAPSALVHLLSGFGAEAVSCIVWVPVDVIKERLQAQGPDVVGRYRNSLHGIRTCLHNESIRGLYVGYASTLASFGPFSALHFMFFEHMKQLLIPLHLSIFVQSLLAGLMSTVMALVTTHPLELIKTRLQVQRPILRGAHAASEGMFGYMYKGMLDGFGSIVRQHGPLGLWRGLSGRLLFGAPNAALSMACYQWSSKFIKRCAKEEKTITG